MAKRKWLLYAMGSGWGHLNRSLALGRVAAKTHSIEIICNTAYSKNLDNFPAWRAEREHLDIHLTDLSGKTRKDICSYFEEAISWNDYECLVVDTFPRGITGELKDVLPRLEHLRRVLVSRQLNQKYVKQFELVSFARSNFDDVINPGDYAGTGVQVEALVHTPPWLIRSCNELPSRIKMRESLGISADKAFILVIAAGSKLETEFYGHLTNRLTVLLPDATVRCLSFKKPGSLSPDLWINHWPGIECIAACDIAIGGAGYNTIAECRALNVPLIAIPQSRTYDTQSVRARQGATCYAHDFETVKTVLLQLERNWKPHSSVATYDNGAEVSFSMLNR